MNKTKIYWRINERIFASKVRVIGQDGKQIGVMTRQKALEEAKKAGLDLIEIAPKATPPVTKIADVNKLRYQEGKKASAERKKSKAAEQKEIRFSPFIGEKDYQTRLIRVKKFLDNGHKVKVTIKFLGRQMGKKQFGYKLVQKMSNDLADHGQIESEPKFLGRHLMTIFAKVKKPKTKENAETKNQKVNNETNKSNPKR